MNERPFREHHLLTLLETYEEQSLPLDRYLSDYFRENRALGSKDRGMIAEAVYGMTRWLGLLDHILEKEGSWEERWELYGEIDPTSYKDDESIPPNVRVSFPEVLYSLLVASHGIEKANELCLTSNFPAPTTVRANALKITRDELFNRWNGIYEVSPCKESEVGITFNKKINLFGLPEFKNGFFEVQDEASQLLANLVETKSGDHVFDYCSGSGGKTLAFAPKMNNGGQIYLHDIRSYILTEAKRRMKRAGIQNAQIVEPDSPKLKRLKKKMDWVLVDAPCTGTGTLRRNPDMKWKFNQEMVTRLQGQQRHIFEKALSYLKPQGKIVYATCSLLKEENQDQVEHFLKTYNLKLVGEPFQTLPSKGKGDGFFAATFMSSQ